MTFNNFRYFSWLKSSWLWLSLLCLIGLTAPWEFILDQAQESFQRVRATVEFHPTLVALGYAGCYCCITGISVPGPTVLVLNVLAGWLFGLWGLPLASLCSSTGGSHLKLINRW